MVRVLSCYPVDNGAFMGLCLIFYVCLCKNNGFFLDRCIFMRIFAI
nr:MAG TPA: hypothetical protein [Caudoviricetes sp.]